MYTVECRVGRLIEARLFGLKSVSEVEQLWEAQRGALARVNGRAVAVTDCRYAHIVAPEVAAQLIELLTRSNRYLEASAFLLSRDQATFNMQVERLVREADNPFRRTFRDVAALEAFLGAYLTPAERDRVHLFLREQQAA